MVAPRRAGRVLPGARRTAVSAALAALTVLGGCHVTGRVDETLAGETSTRPRRGVAPRRLPPTATVTSDGYLTGLGVDPRVERLRKVPRIEPTELTITRARDGDAAVIRIAVTFTNSGPGDAWGVRGILSSRDSGIEGRILYVGHLPAESSTTRTLTLPLTSSSSDLTDAAISVVARDAHATTAMIPLRFHGPVLDATAP